jgi:hypothetical protein
VILGFLNGMRAAHGSVEAFLRARGVTEGDLARFRDQLLD